MIKKIQEFLKKIFQSCFSKKEEAVKQKDISKVQEEATNPDYIGKVLYCRMPLTDEEKQDIPEGHQQRPYVIVYQDDKSLYGYPCTSKTKERVPEYKKYLLLNSDLNNQKSIVLLENLIELPFENMMYEMFDLQAYQIQELARKIHILHMTHPEKKIFNFDIEISIKEGDIIQANNQTYLVRRINNLGIQVYTLIKKSNKDTYKVQIRKNKWFVNVLENTYLPIKMHKQIIFHLENYSKILQNINDKKKRIKTRYKSGGIIYE